MSCNHAEDVCQDCLEKVQTTTEYSQPKKVALPLGAKAILLPILSSVLAASGVLWVISTKTAKATLEVIGAARE